MVNTSRNLKFTPTLRAVEKAMLIATTHQTPSVTNRAMTPTTSHATCTRPKEVAVAVVVERSGERALVITTEYDSYDLRERLIFSLG